MIRDVIRKNNIIYTVSVSIWSMAASIIFLTACTRRVFPVDTFLSRYVAPLSAMCIVLVHRPFILPQLVDVVFVA